MANVKLEHIRKVFGKDTVVIPSFNLEIRDGEFLVFVGPSGCGKSTLLRMIAGLENPTSGEIYIGDDCVTNVPPKDRNIAMVFQNYALYPHMNVFDNLAFGLKLRKTPKEKIKVRVENATQILKIEDLIYRKPKELSGGQSQRVALGRAIVRKPQVFLLDEPLSNLDAKLRVVMRAEIIKLHKQLRTTMIYVTHDQVEAMTMGDRIVILNNGIIQQVGKPMNIYKNPKNMFVAGFIGSPPMNLLKGRIEKNMFKADSLSIDLWGVKNIEALNDKPVILGIRPGTIRLADDGHSLPLIVAEQLGNETILHLRVGEDKLIAKVRGIDAAELNDVVKIKFNIKALYFFDSLTQNRIL